MPNEESYMAVKSDAKFDDLIPFRLMLWKIPESI